MLRVIDEIRPTWVVGENVAGITTMVESCEVVEVGSEGTLFDEVDRVHRFRAEETFTIERVCCDLESKGYSVQPVLIPACGVGAHHRRDRIFIIAYNTDCGDDLRGSGKDAGKEREEWVCERNEIRIPGESDNVRSEIEEFSDNTCVKGLEGSDESGSCEGRKRMYLWRDITGCGGTTDLRPEGRWKAFPTVSLVHRGNDGLPFDVDNLTIPFSKWRNETIKAYGNAIVPQVMYRIFQAIESHGN